MLASGSIPMLPTSGPAEPRLAASADMLSLHEDSSSSGSSRRNPAASAASSNSTTISNNTAAAAATTAAAAAATSVATSASSPNGTSEHHYGQDRAGASPPPPPPPPPSASGFTSHAKSPATDDGFAAHPTDQSLSAERPVWSPATSSTLPKTAPGIASATRTPYEGVVGVDEPALAHPPPSLSAAHQGERREGGRRMSPGAGSNALGAAPASAGPDVHVASAASIVSGVDSATARTSRAFPPALLTGSDRSPLAAGSAGGGAGGAVPSSAKIRAEGAWSGSDNDVGAGQHKEGEAGEAEQLRQDLERAVMSQKKRKLAGDAGRDVSGNVYDDSSSSGRAGGVRAGSSNTGEVGPVGMDHDGVEVGRMEKATVGRPTEKYPGQGQYAAQRYAEPSGKGKLPDEERGAAGFGGMRYMDVEEDRVRRNKMMHCRGGAGEVGAGGDAGDDVFGGKSTAAAGAASASSQEQVCIFVCSCGSYTHCLL